MVTRYFVIGRAGRPSQYFDMAWIDHLSDGRVEEDAYVITDC
jgi:hypothetical protein